LRTSDGEVLALLLDSLVRPASVARVEVHGALAELAGIVPEELGRQRRRCVVASVAAVGGALLGREAFGCSSQPDEVEVRNSLEPWMDAACEIRDRDEKIVVHSLSFRYSQVTIGSPSEKRVPLTQELTMAARRSFLRAGRSLPSNCDACRSRKAAATAAGGQQLSDSNLVLEAARLLIGVRDRVLLGIAIEVLSDEAECDRE